MKRTLVAVLVAFVAAACSDSSPNAVAPLSAGVSPTIVSADVIVTNSNDAGPGSFRAAIAQANGNNAIGSIGFAPEVNTIALQSGIVFSGTQDLTIHGNQSTLDASGAGGTGFLATGGGDLTVTGLTVRNADGQGVEVRLPVGVTGTVRVELDNVDIVGSTGHGFMVDDQVNNTAASVDVSVANSRILGNGYSVSDRDGIRVNEGGPGNLNFATWNSRFENNAADGIELDETGDGNVVIDVRSAAITRNGIFDPADLDDGFDIDEAGNGSITGHVASTSANHNFEEGLDFNENDAGDLRVDLTDVDANDNREEGIDYEEDDDFAGGGDLVTVMTRVTTLRNGASGGDGGLKIREKGEGNLDVTLSDIIASQNSVAGVHARETEAGNALVRVTHAVTNGNDGHGIEVREGSSGNITLATFVDITTSGNGGFGLSVENGTANITNVKGGGNASGLTGGGATFVDVP